jgi:hypothetical protein
LETGERKGIGVRHGNPERKFGRMKGIRGHLILRFSHEKIGDKGTEKKSPSPTNLKNLRLPTPSSVPETMYFPLKFYGKITWPCGGGC